VSWDFADVSPDGGVSLQVPYPHGPYVYYSKTEKGKSYRVYCRKRRSPGASTAAAGAEEEVVLDVNELAAPHKHYDLGSFAPCPDDHSLIAFTYDTTAYEDFTLAILDTKTGKLLQDQMCGLASLAVSFVFVCCV